MIDSVKYLCSDEEILQRAVTLTQMWLEKYLISEEYESTFKALNLAEALARYYVRLLQAGEDESVRVGDITVRKNNEKLLEIETRLKNDAIAAAAEILRDGEFYFGSV